MAKRSAVKKAWDDALALYRTDTIGDGYVLRAVEGYTADGGHIDLQAR